MNDAALGVFLAQLSTGDWLLETVDLVGALSPWQILMARCKKEKVYLTDLRLRAGHWLVETRPNAPGYFYAIKLFRGLGTLGSTQEVNYKGVGWVSEDRTSLSVIWASTRGLVKCSLCSFAARQESAMEPRLCEKCAGGTVTMAPDAWRETRPVIGNLNIIWSIPRKGGAELDTVVRDGHLWLPGPGDTFVRADAR